MTPTDFSRLHKLIWVLIYGGLLCIVTSLFVARADQGDGVLAFWMAAGGGVLVVGGIALIFFRSKFKSTP